MPYNKEGYPYIKLPGSNQKIFGEFVKFSNGELFKADDGKLYAGTPVGRRDATGEYTNYTWSDFGSFKDIVKKPKIYLEDVVNNPDYVKDSQIRVVEQRRAFKRKQEWQDRIDTIRSLRKDYNKYKMT